MSFLAFRIRNGFMNKIALFIYTYIYLIKSCSVIYNDWNEKVVWNQIIYGIRTEPRKGHFLNIGKEMSLPGFRTFGLRTQFTCSSLQRREHCRCTCPGISPQSYIDLSHAATA